MFLEALGEACGRTGWKCHAYALMPNHYHLVLETPEPNLVAGMAWLQNTYTRRHNVRHKLWGHLFGGRYKAVLVDDEMGTYEGRAQALGPLQLPQGMNLLAHSAHPQPQGNGPKCPDFRRGTHFAAGGVWEMKAETAVLTFSRRIPSLNG